MNSIDVRIEPDEEHMLPKFMNNGDRRFYVNVNGMRHAGPYKKFEYASAELGRVLASAIGPTVDGAYYDIVLFHEEKKKIAAEKAEKRLNRKKYSKREEY